MNDLAQFNLATVPQVDWDSYGKTSVAPPPALDASGKPIIYYGIVEKATEIEPADGVYLNFLLDPITLTGDGAGKGYQIRFTRQSARPYMYTAPDGTKQPKKGNPNGLADFLRSTGLQGKPQTADQVRACVAQVVSLKKPFGFSIDWEAYNKETGERVKGFNAFPIGADGSRSWVVKAGQLVNVLDSKGVPTGQTETVKSEILFANARLRFFRDVKGGK